MLLKMQWDVEKLQVKYFEDPEKTMKELFNLEEGGWGNPEEVV